jgi:hypothetical protein
MAAPQTLAGNNLSQINGRRNIVMTGLVPVIHDFMPARWCRPKSWMPAFAGMTGKPLQFNG